jgi:hypothetical protein
MRSRGNRSARREFLGAVGVIGGLLLAVSLAGCSQTPPSTPTVVAPPATPTAVVEPTQTPTKVPTETPRPSNTPSKRPTETPKPTNTATKEPTATPRPTNTPQPAATRVTSAQPYQNVLAMPGWLRQPDMTRLADGSLQLSSSAAAAKFLVDNLADATSVSSRGFEVVVRMKAVSYANPSSATVPAILLIDRNKGVPNANWLLVGIGPPGYGIMVSYKGFQSRLDKYYPTAAKVRPEELGSKPWAAEAPRSSTSMMA